MIFGVDIEPTNRCNASCHFCPRDQTPHQGLMTPETFAQSLARTVELAERLRSVGEQEMRVSLCGLGEPLLNKHTPEFVGRVRAAGLPCTMSSNGALLDQRRGAALLEAGLQKIWLNVGEIDDAYEQVYELPFARTRDNILRFREEAGDACDVVIVLVDHRQDSEHLESLRQYWRGHGITAFAEYEVMNRGGALFVDHMQYLDLPQRAEAERLLATSGGEAICPTPFFFLFIGYDGEYYLCCSDWKKEAPLGSVFDRSFAEVMDAKLAITRRRRPVCETCNLDPLNKMIEALCARDAGEPDAPDPVDLVERIVRTSAASLAGIELVTGRPAPGPGDEPGPERRSIPVTAI